jgi:hypothetical protein
LQMAVTRSWPFHRERIVVAARSFARPAGRREIMGACMVGATGRRGNRSRRRPEVRSVTERFLPPRSCRRTVLPDRTIQEGTVRVDGRSLLVQGHTDRVFVGKMALGGGAIVKQP